MPRIEPLLSCLSFRHCSFFRLSRLKSIMSPARQGHGNLPLSLAPSPSTRHDLHLHLPAPTDPFPPDLPARLDVQIRAPPTWSSYSPAEPRAAPLLRPPPLPCAYRSPSVPSPLSCGHTLARSASPTRPARAARRGRCLPITRGRPRRARLRWEGSGGEEGWGGSRTSWWRWTRGLGRRSAIAICKTGQVGERGVQS